MSNSCILFCAHFLSPSIISEFQKLQESGYSVFLLYDNSRSDFEVNHFAPETVQLFTRDQIASCYDMTSCSPEGRIYDGNTTFPILWFGLQHSAYDFIWRIEYDVRFNGAWSQFFSAFETNSSDLLTTTLARPEDFPRWQWWKTFQTPWWVFRKPPMIRGFLPVCRFSKKAIKVLDNAYRNGWAGHDEVSVPTILRAKGCVIEDIGGEGEFVRFGNKNRFYTNTPGSGNYLAPGTFVCPPAVAAPLDQPGKLYHPVK